MPFARLISPLLDRLRRRRLSNSLMRQADGFYVKGSFAEAADLYQQAVDIEPERPVLRYNLGLALYKGGKKQQGRAEWKRVVELAQGKNAYMVEQAEILLRQFG